MFSYRTSKSSSSILRPTKVPEEIDIIEAIHSIVRIALRRNSSDLMKYLSIPKDSLLTIPKEPTLKQIKEASERITTNYNSSYYCKSLKKCDEIIMKELNDYISKKSQDEKNKFPYSRICELEDEKKSLENKIKYLEKDNKRLKENISLLEHNNKTLEDKLTEVTKEKQLSSEYRSKYYNLVSKCNKVFDEKNDLKSKIDEKYKDDSLNKNLNEAIDNAIDKLNSQISVIDSSKDDKIKELENKIKDSENKNKELENKYKYLLREIETLRNINQSLVENKFDDFIKNF